MTTARLGFEVHSEQAKSAAVDLDKLTGSAERAEKAERGLATASKQAEASAAGLAAINRTATGTTAGLASAEGQVATRMTMATTAVRANTAALEINAAAAGKARAQSRQLMFQLVDVGQALPLLLSGNIYGLQNLGFQIAQIGQLYAGEGGLTAAIRDSTVMVGRFVAKLGPVAAVVGGIGLSFAALRSEINETSKTAVSFGDVALGAWQTLRDAVATTIQPAIDAISGAFSAFWEWFEGKAKEQFNLFIGNAVQLAEQMKFAVTTIQTYWTAGYAAIKAVWSGLPGALGNVVYSTANAVIGGVEAMVNAVTGKINEYIGKINEMVKSLPFGIGDNINVGTIGEVKFGRLSDPNAGDAANLRSQLSDIFGTANQNVADAYSAMQGRVAEAKGTDFFGALRVNAVANAMDRVTEAAKKAGSAGKAAGDKIKDGAKAAADAWEKTKSALQQAGQSTGGILKGLISGTLSWKDALSQALSVALKLMTSINPNLFGGEFFQGLLGGLLGFASGGYTGSGAASSVAGVVHGGEYVFSKRATDRIGVSALDQLHRQAKGYAGGGHVAPVRMPANDQPLRIELVSRFDADGGFETAVERSSRPVAQQEAVRATGKLASAVPGMVDARTDERETRRIAPRRFIA